jgi:hypothetical protein
MKMRFDLQGAGSRIMVMPILLCSALHVPAFPCTVCSSISALTSSLLQHGEGCNALWTEPKSRIIFLIWPVTGTQSLQAAWQTLQENAEREIVLSVYKEAKANVP